MIQFFRSGKASRNSSPNIRMALCKEEQWPDLVKSSFDRPVYVFKHSERCGISDMVRRRFENQMSKLGETYYCLQVQSCRSLSKKLELDLGIRHESPQLIILKDGKVAAHASHFALLDMPALK
jgi:bacillithiol system protein YtxJ